MSSLDYVYAYSGDKELQNIVEYRRKNALGWSDRFASFGPVIIKNLNRAKRQNEARKK